VTVTGAGGPTGGIGGGRRGGGPAGSGGGTATQAAGDTSHCVGGRQFDPAKFAYAPPCVPKFAGDNGGATYQGVTKDTIKVIQYRANLGAAVDALLTAQGANPTTEQMQAMLTAVTKFINENYELYGRKYQVKLVNGQCNSVPPDYPCLRGEFRRIIQEEKPFAIIWVTSLASPAFDEMSKLGVVNLGGWGFRDSFNQAHRPYHWDLQMGGSQLVAHVGEWYCKRMAGGKAEYAGADPNPTEDLRNKPRVLGVISTDDPENKLAIDELKGHLAKCGVRIAAEYYYAQDITTADQQRRAAVSKMINAGVTTIMCFCDLVAPIFLYNTCEEQRYYPEHVMVATGYMDTDRAAQAYDHTLPPDNVTPAHQFENAFGLAQNPKPVFREQNTAARLMKAAGNFNQFYDSAEVDMTYHLMLATLIQAAGPNLTPQNLEAGAFRLPPVGALDNDELTLRQFKPGDYTWTDALREVYWSPTRPSSFNRQPGAYVNVNGNRWFQLGQYPSGLLRLPPKPRS
jgi:hypothetical protein